MWFAASKLLWKHFVHWAKYGSHDTCTFQLENLKMPCLLQLQNGNTWTVIYKNRIVRSCKLKIRVEYKALSEKLGPVLQQKLKKMGGKDMIKFLETLGTHIKKIGILWWHLHFNKAKQCSCLKFLVVIRSNYLIDQRRDFMLLEHIDQRLMYDWNSSFLQRKYSARQKKSLTRSRHHW